MGLDFTAVDVETANPARASVCQLGAVIVRDGVVVDQREWLIRPPTGLLFTNTWLHGIGPSEVMDAPEYPRVFLEFADWAGATRMVSYSAFDRGVVRAAHEMTGLPAWPAWLWYDALVLARQRLQLDHYRLPDVAKCLGVGLDDHHQAGADALACARVVLGIAERDGCDDLPGLWFGVPPRPVRRSSEVKRIPKPAGDADPANPLFGQVMCFTGRLDQFTRAEAQEVAASFGARVVGSVSKKTTIVVEGEFDPASLRKGDALSLKARKALELAGSGVPIQIINEFEFMDLLNY